MSLGKESEHSLAGSSELGPHKTVVKVLAGALVLTETQGSCPCSVVARGICFPAAVELTEASAKPGRKSFI